MSGLIHTVLGLSSLIAHVLHSPPPPPVNSFVIGPAVINTHTTEYLGREKRRKKMGKIEKKWGEKD